MKKRLCQCLALFLTAALLCALAPAYAGAARFSDVSAGSWYASAVQEMVDRGIMNGKGTNTFKPNGTLTRGEFVTMLARTALSEGELGQYTYRGIFSDVPQKHWANRYVNWASEAGVAGGVGGGKFEPEKQLTRQDMAVMVVKYAKATGLDLPAINGPKLFLDYRSISSYAVDSVTKCQRAGVIDGYGDMTFRPKGVAKRSEAAVLYSRFLQTAQSAGYKIIRKRLNGMPIAAVEFDPGQFTAGVALGNDRVRGAEQAKSLFSRVGAKIAVNGGFFEFGSYDAYGTIIHEGRPITVYNQFSPAKSAIVMDSSGRFSVENYRTNISATVSAADGRELTVKDVGANRFPYDPKDGTRLIFTSDWGGSLGFQARYAAVVDGSGRVTALCQNQDVSIPKDGYVLAQRGPRADDSFIQAATPGAYLRFETEYTGSSTQDVELSIAAGPKIVENGRPYGNASTYAAEGLGGIGGESQARRVCIGVRYDGSLLILTAYASLPELSGIMAVMGCQSAVNLDGGGSTNLYVNGQWLYGPTDRALNNALYFK
ncbi:hypothetical protein D7X94_03835 [Acutalibacter sp. 1XD8-33]|uniref:S-layer homology domain-containing protein n=1 Tax=Acutalibacter sp. 1XD8-33 TaxID=2320081 RepID=UPI000EA2A0CC|nr:S-layer homology domain-containing protein [Acutalibacter sp. 1XD8-33]RKJ41429.1 hypothetical protein D7X94_03835 [Acutalibacter sp. 1XD8-33]